MSRLLACLLVVATGLGCVRTTSIGRATSATDAQADGDASSADAHADHDTGTPADAPADLPREAPIIGNGRDAATDEADGPDAADAP